MLGNKWEPAQGTIVDAQTLPGGGRGGMQLEHRYVVEVRRPTGEVIRSTVTDRSPGGYGVGTVIGVEVHAKSGEMRLDPSQQIFSVGAMMNAAGQMPGFDGPIGPYSHGAPGGNVLHVLGPGGQDLAIQFDAGQIAGLAQAIRSGDPAARQAAMDQLRALRDQARGQAAGQPGGWQSPGAPSGPPPPGGGTEQRLAMIKQLLDNGMISESEYQAKRQQIIDGL
jgi:hypothetical protein